MTTLYVIMNGYNKPRGLHVTIVPFGVRGAAEDLRGHSQPVFGLVAALRVRRFPAGEQLFVPRGLRGPRE